MSVFRSRYGFLSVLPLLVAGMTSCAQLQFLPFLKRQVNNDPRGISRTDRGPAFTTTSGRRTQVDPASDWPAYNNTPSSDRFSPLAQITTANVASLRPVCTAQLGEEVPMQAGPVVVGGVMYVTTANNTYAFDAANCNRIWRHLYAYDPQPDYDLKVNRGVAYLDGVGGPRLFRGANDGRVYAMDARTGAELWNVLAGNVGKGESFPAAPVAWRGMVYMGNAGGDNYGVTGRMMAFDAGTGAMVWSFDLVPKTGEAALTWPAETNRVPRAGATTWTSYTIDTTAGVIYMSTGNAAPDFLDEVRQGTNLHTYSVVGLDARTGELRKAYQLLHHDVHDYDVAAAPVLLTTSSGRHLISAAGKDGHIYGVDRDSDRILYQTEITTIENPDAPLTAAGTRYCPGVQGGTEWNGPAFMRSTNLLYVNSVDWCVTVQTAPAKKLKNKLGIPWTGSSKLREPFGKMDPKERGHGWLTAVDADDGSIKWRYASPTPMVAAVTTTAGGLVFTADLRGNLIAFDAKDGRELFRYNTGQPIGGGIVSYSVGGKQYIAVASGLNAPLSWQTKSEEAKVVVLALP